MILQCLAACNRPLVATTAAVTAPSVVAAPAQVCTAVFRKISRAANSRALWLTTAGTDCRSDCDCSQMMTAVPAAVAALFVVTRADTPTTCSIRSCTDATTLMRSCGIFVIHVLQTNHSLLRRNTRSEHHRFTPSYISGR